MINNKKIIFIGLGTMGYHMAGHLSKSVSNLSVWNRSKEKSQQWQQQFTGQVANTLTKTVANADVIITCTGRDEDMTQILFAEDGIANFLKKDAIVIDHTTTSCQFAKQAGAQLAKANVHFLDAPISGGEAAAKQGSLSIMVGGDPNKLETIKPLLSSYGKNIVHIGAIGYGQLTKMANQICIAGVIQGLSEALLFAEAEKIDISKLLAAIAGGAAQSWQMENRMTTMHKREFDFGFAIEWMVKDLSYCLNQAKINKTPLDMTQQIHDKYVQLMQSGDNRKDTSALLLFDEKKANA